MNRKTHAPDLVQLARKFMVDHGFDIDLDASDWAELREVTEALRDPEKRKDLRKMLWSSIDNVDSKDLDQVEYAEKLDGGKIRLFVGIADVDACVEKDGRIDTYAATNSTSVYTGVKVFAMLPEVLSNDRTSLLPREDREAMVMQIDVDADGAVSQFDVYFGIIHNHAKLAYERVAAWLKGKDYDALEAVPGLAEQIKLQEEVCLRLRAANERAGALTVQTLEARPIAVDGVVVDLQLTETNRARDMVQSFMTTMNSALARYMHDREVAIIQRIVKKPARWPKLVSLAATYGVTLPAEPDAVALAQFVASRRAADPAGFPEFSTTVVKLLGPGQYIVHVPGTPGEGHFGLAVHEYTHATAPNRRYADLVLQRMVKAIQRREPTPYNPEALQVIADRCMERENAARKVERSMRKAAAAVLLEPRIGEEFDAIVTGAASKGVYVRLLRPPAEGRVLRGERGLDVGDKVRVRLINTDYKQGFIDFEVSSPAP
jgi:VacB/RNase II family 3'-5' exoribonuclease